MSEFLITLWCGPRGAIQTQFGPQNCFFCLILQEFYDFFRAWDTPNDVVFAEILVLSIIFGFLVVNWVPKWTKTVNVRCGIWAKMYNFERFLKHCICLIGRLNLVKISARWNNIWESKGSKPQKRGHFIDAESIQKALKIFTFTTTNATLMKLITDIYLNKVFHLAKFRV